MIDKKNGGVSSARNLGIKEARGQYIWFVDGDDWIAENSIDVIAGEIKDQNRLPDSVLFSFCFVNSYENKPVKACKGVAIDGGYGDIEGTYANSVWCRWLLTERVRAMNSGFDESMKYAEDTLFLAHFRAISRSMLIINEKMYYYLNRPESAMHRLDANSHAYSMLRLAVGYQEISKSSADAGIKKRMQRAKVRSMQAFCRDLCFYCNDFQTVRRLIAMLKKEKLYPFGVDWGNFRIDKRQSRKNDLMNWIFGFISFEPYLYLCWFICGKAFSKKRQQFRIEDLQGVMYLAAENH